MGNEYSMNVFICGYLTDVILKNVIFKLFKEKGDKGYSKFEPRDYDFNIRFCLNKPLDGYKFYWIGHIFKEGNLKNIIENIGKGIQIMNQRYYEENSHKIDIRRNNVILCFLKPNEDSSVVEDPIKSMNVDLTLTESNNPIIVTVGGQNADENFEKLKPLNRLPGGNDDDILRNVHSKLLTIDAYLNERGNIFDQIVYRNLGRFNNVTATTCLDILIYGGSHSGKSTFINILSNQLLARVQRNPDTCTTKCTEYIIPLEDMNNNIQQNNQELMNQALEEVNQFSGKLKLIDTPGLLDDTDVKKVCKIIQNYIDEEAEIIQLALFIMKDTATLNKSKEVLKLLIQNNIPVFFIQTHCREENQPLENLSIYQDVRTFITNNFRADKDNLLIQKGNEIYNIIRMNQKIDNEHPTIFGIDVLLEKILHFFLYERINSLLESSLTGAQNFFEQREILCDCRSDITRNGSYVSLHNVLFRKFLTLANVSEYYERKAASIIASANFICCSSCLIPIPFVDLPIYYTAHYFMVLGILSIFGIRFGEVSFRTIMKTNGTNLGGEYNTKRKLVQYLNTGIKAVLNIGKLGSDASSFVPIFGIFSRVADVIFSAIDTTALGGNLVKTCNKLPKNQQFFKNELEKFNYVLRKLDEIKSRIGNNNNNN